MRKIKTTYDQAIEQYVEYFGKNPTVTQINDLYHKYSCDWKHFDGFTDWLNYQTP